MIEHKSVDLNINKISRLQKQSELKKSEGTAGITLGVIIVLFAFF